MAKKSDMPGYSYTTHTAMPSFENPDDRYEKVGTTSFTKKGKTTTYNLTDEQHDAINKNGTRKNQRYAAQDQAYANGLNPDVTSPSPARVNSLKAQASDEAKTMLEGLMEWAPDLASIPWVVPEGQEREFAAYLNGIMYEEYIRRYNSPSNLNTLYSAGGLNTAMMWGSGGTTGTSSQSTVHQGVYSKGEERQAQAAQAQAMAAQQNAASQSQLAMNDTFATSAQSQKTLADARGQMIDNQLKSIELEGLNKAGGAGLVARGKSADVSTSESGAVTAGNEAAASSFLPAQAQADLEVSEYRKEVMTSEINLNDARANAAAKGAELSVAQVTAIESHNALLAKQVEWYDRVQQAGLAQTYASANSLNTQAELNVACKDTEVALRDYRQALLGAQRRNYEANTESTNQFRSPLVSLYRAQEDELQKQIEQLDQLIINLGKTNSWFEYNQVLHGVDTVTRGVGNVLGGVKGTGALPQTITHF